MAEITWTIPAQGHEWEDITEAVRYPSGDVDAHFGDRYGVLMEFDTGSVRGRELEALIADAKHPGNVVLVSHRDILDYRRWGSGSFTVDGAVAARVSTLTVNNNTNADGTDATIEVGDYFAVNHECHICTTARVVGSATAGDRQLTLTFKPPLRSAVTDGATIALDNPIYKMLWSPRNPQVHKIRKPRELVYRSGTKELARWRRQTRVHLEEPRSP